MNGWFPKLVMALLMILAVALLAVLVVYLVDQSTGKSVAYQNMTVEDKRFYTTILLMPVGKVTIPEIQYHWDLSFRVNGQVLTGDVLESCYNRVSVGDKMDIKVVYGKYTTGVYPVCN